MSEFYAGHSSLRIATTFAHLRGMAENVKDIEATL